MLHEYALDPNVLHNFDKVRYFLEKFGVHRGRLIARFPGKWERMVRQVINSCGEIEKARIIECLLMAKDSLVKSQREYDGNISWIENAEAQHALKPFHAIISTSNPRATKEVLRADELTDATPLWQVSRERVVPRKAAELATAVQPLFQIASEILFIDPYFDPSAPRYWKTLKSFTRIICADTPLRKIEFYLKFDPNFASFKRCCNDNIPQILPDGFQMRFVQLRQRDRGETLHPRYILTDKGGVRFEHGLDEGRDGEYTDVSLLSLHVYQQRWKDYYEARAFEVVDEITIVGS